MGVGGPNRPGPGGPTTTTTTTTTTTSPGGGGGGGPSGDCGRRQPTRIFDGSAMRVEARDPNGAIRAMSLTGHPFFLGAAFQPERAALTGRRHPIVSAFLGAVVTALTG